MAHNSIDLMDGNRALNIADEVERDEETRASLPPRVYGKDDGWKITPHNTYYDVFNSTVPGSTTQEPRSANELTSSDTTAMLHSLARRYRTRRRRKFQTADPELRRKRKRAKSLDCRVSPWSSWSECAGGCGVGESVRTRRVTRRTRRGGAECPPLTQTRWCAPLDCTRAQDAWPNTLT